MKLTLPNNNNKSFVLDFSKKFLSCVSEENLLNKKLPRRKEGIQKGRYA